MPFEEIDDHALEQALTAPGTPAELADEETYLAMFRAAQPGGPRGVVPATRRTARRVGTTATLAVIVAVTTGGVAAAYSSNLPRPVQRVVHSVLAPLGVPQAEPEDEPTEPAPTSATPNPTPTPVAPPVPRPSSSPSALPSETPSPTVDPTASPTDGLTESPSGDPSSTDPASPSATPSDTTEPTPTEPPAPVPAAVTISSVGAGEQVAPGGTAVVTGRVTAADGSPVAGVRVALQSRGSAGWTRLGVARTDANGSVALSTGPVQRTLELRLATAKVVSASRTLVVQPSVRASAQTSGQSATVSVSANGGQAGDQVALLTRRDGQMVQEGTARLDGSGNVRFTVVAPLEPRVYVVRLLGTQDHAEATTQVTVRAADGPNA